MDSDNAKQQHDTEKADIVICAAEKAACNSQHDKDCDKGSGYQRRLYEERADFPKFMWISYDKGNKGSGENKQENYPPEYDFEWRALLFEELEDTPYDEWQYKDVSCRKQ